MHGMDRLRWEYMLIKSRHSAIVMRNMHLNVIHGLLALSCAVVMRCPGAVRGLDEEIPRRAPIGVHMRASGLTWVSPSAATLVHTIQALEQASLGHRISSIPISRRARP